MITRHYLEVAGRRVHYHKAGAGPPLIMAHQSPRSSAEYAPLMARWAEHFTCIAPDTPGFGQSDPLPGTPEIDQFGDALVAFVDALRLERVAAYGFHSGGIILMNALKRHPGHFATLAIGGYAIWTEAEMQLFGEAYLPPFQPLPYGEHLTWLWNRVLEQSWFFPWFDVRPEARLSVAHDDVAKIHAVVMDMLDAGDAYRAGYGAVLRAARDIPPPGAATPPVLIAAYDGDPLQPHIDRIGGMPADWRVEKINTPAALEAAALEHLLATPLPDCPALPESGEAGFHHVATPDFDGAIHWWRGGDGALGFDLPGHGLSEDWPGEAPTDWATWHAVIEQIAPGAPTSPAPVGDPALLFPDLTPDRFGAYLTTAWSIARARHLFAPWYEANAAHAVAFDAQALAPERLAVEHRALLRARAARACAIALQREER